jgi:ankyrin repeat protein
MMRTAHGGKGDKGKEEGRSGEGRSGEGRGGDGRSAEELSGDGRSGDLSGAASLPTERIDAPQGVVAAADPDEGAEAAELLPLVPDFSADALECVLRQLPCPPPSAVRATSSDAASAAAEPTPTTPTPTGGVERGHVRADEALLVCKRVCKGWLAGARRVLSDADWLAARLHLRDLLVAGAPPSAVRRRLAARPTEANETLKRRSVLHVACEHAACACTLSALLTAAPQHAAGRDIRNVLPLHLACQTASANADACAAVELLLGAYPYGRALLTKERKAPLHLACEHSAGVDVVRALLRMPPGASGGADCASGGADAPRGPPSCLPAAVSGASAAASGAAAPVPRDAQLGIYASERQPSACEYAAMRGKREMLPLHLACAHGACADVVSALLGAYPEGATERDREGLLPLHHACSPTRRDAAPPAASEPRVLALLLAAHPVSTSWPCADLVRLGALGEPALRHKLRAQPWHARLADDARQLPLHAAAVRD